MARAKRSWLARRALAARVSSVTSEAITPTGPKLPSGSARGKQVARKVRSLPPSDILSSTFRGRPVVRTARKTPRMRSAPWGSRTSPRRRPSMSSARRPVIAPQVWLDRTTRSPASSMQMAEGEWSRMACSRERVSRRATSATCRAVMSAWVPTMRSGRPAASRATTRPLANSQRQVPSRERMRNSAS